MADYDQAADGYSPNQIFAPRQAPTISALKTALSTHSSTSYSASRMASMTKNDLIHAARLHDLYVPGITTEEAPVG